MTLRYNHQGSMLYIEPLGDVTLTAGPDTLKRINLITFGQIRRATLVINAATLAGSTTLIAYIGTTGTGGTDTAIATMTMPSASSNSGDYVLEVPAELIAQFEDRNGGPGTAKSLAFKIDGALNDVIQAAIVVERLHAYADQTTADVTATT